MFSSSPSFVVFFFFNGRFGFHVIEPDSGGSFSAFFLLSPMGTGSQVPIKRAEEVEEVFDAISYSKGGSVVRMIYSVLGEKDMGESGGQKPGLKGKSQKEDRKTGVFSFFFG